LLDQPLDLTEPISPRSPIAYRLLLIPALVHLLVHLLTNGNYGMFRDEYYYLACADHLAWGYVDQPPLSIVLLAIWKAVWGDSLTAIRVVPALCGAGLVLLTGMLAAELGARKYGQLLAAVAMAVGVVGLVITGFYSMNALDFIFWTAAYLLLARILRTGQQRNWYWLGLVLACGLLNKIGLLVFGLALVVGLLLARQWAQFRHRQLWLAGGLALAGLLPYLLWNLAHDWPTLEFIRNAKLYKISDLSPLAFISENVLEANPLTLPIWLAGLGWLLLASRAIRWRTLGWIFLAALVILIVQKSKPYYLGAAFPVLMAAGGAAWEGWTRGPRIRWFRYVLLTLVVLGGVVLLPMTVPVLSVADFNTYQQRLGISPETGEDIRGDVMPQYFSDRFGWQEMTDLVAGVYSGLSPAEQAACVILATNYGQAGGVQYRGRGRGLPPVVCLHNNYWLWGPGERDWSVVICVGGSREQLEEYFSEVVEAGRVTAPGAIENGTLVSVCRDLKFPLTETWGYVKLFV